MNPSDLLSPSKLVWAAILLFPISACKKDDAPVSTGKEAANPREAEDIPVLPVSPGLQWRYTVTVENPQDSRSGQLASGKFERIRSYLGKIDPGNGHPPSDCFEVSAEGAPTSREFVHIMPEAVSILGHAELDAGGVQKTPVWFEKPIPFFRAGLTAGDSMPLTVLNNDKNLWRGTRVIGREKTTVPAGVFETIRLQMFGSDGNISLRKTYWFAPGKGIVREEKIREVDGKPVMTEIEELSAIENGARRQ
jgi:hypothetical protein